MYKTTDQTIVVEMQDIVRTFAKIGFTPVRTGDEVPTEVIRDILNANPAQKNAVLSGRARFAPLEHKEWRNGEDTVTATDYEIREPFTVTRDPFLRVVEVVRGRTSYLVKEILTKELKIDFVKFTISRGLNSAQAYQCIQELATLNGENPRELYNKYAELFMSNWTRIVREPKPVIPKTKRKKVVTYPAGYITEKEMRVGVRA